MILHFFFAASNATAEPREDEEDSEHAHEPETVPDALAIGFLDLSESFVTALVACTLDWFHHLSGQALLRLFLNGFCCLRFSFDDDDR